MEKKMEKEITKIVVDEVAALNRSDLFREPLVAFSSAEDPRYGELKSIIGEWHHHPKELLPEADGIISYFVPFTEEVAKEPNTTKDGSPLWGEAYVVINEYFNRINERVSSYIKEQGYKAAVIPATHTYSPEDLKSMWSHRSAAVIAGLGAFGANRLLITEKGSGGRFCTVLTSAPLKGEKEEDEVRCLYLKSGSCGLCSKVCPVNALDLDGGFRKFVCQDELFRNQRLLEISNGIYGADACGKCISICPVAYLE